MSESTIDNTTLLACPRKHKVDTKTSNIKPRKNLTSEDIQKLCPNVNIIRLNAGPIVLIENKSYSAEVYTCNTIEDVIEFFGRFSGQCIFIYDMDRTLPDKNTFNVYKGDKITIHSGCNEINITVDVDQCNINVQYPELDNINDSYSEFIFRMYSLTTIKSDNFKHCGAITDCIINNIENNLADVVNNILI
jgi:hypothetical protein